MVKGQEESFDSKACPPQYPRCLMQMNNAVDDTEMCGVRSPRTKEKSATLRFAMFRVLQEHFGLQSSDRL